MSHQNGGKVAIAPNVETYFYYYEITSIYNIYAYALQIITVRM